MGECLYYKSERKAVRSKEVRPDRQRPSLQIHVRRWCTHKHSPVTKDKATKAIGGGKLLTCAGDLENKCPLSQEEFVDIAN
jgi:hypothetical protein